MSVFCTKILFCYRNTGVRVALSFAIYLIAHPDALNIQALYVYLIR